MSHNYSVILILVIALIVCTYYFLIVSYYYGLFERDYTLFVPGPKYQPTKGEVWPKPQYQVNKAVFYTLIPLRFKIKVMHETCDIVTAAVERYTNIVTRAGSIRRKSRREGGGNHNGTLEVLHLKLTAPCEEYPHLDMDESYKLHISSVSTLRSQSVWGILRGLETFAQMFHLSDDQSEILIQASVIKDAPRYQHRGLMLDTSRHYISVANVLRTLDAMAINKMNVFHWHIVDDQSFPYQSEKFPEISDMGAYDSSLVYTKEDINKIVQYARDRGIRVVPEFDVPGHTRSWGSAYPDLLVECFKKNKVVGLGPMNPINNFTYELLRDLFREAQNWFPDKYFHIGGDEVSFRCWESNPYLQRYMQENNMDAMGLHALFMTNAIPLLANGSKVIVWQEVFDDDVPLDKETLVQVWKYYWEAEMVKILGRGHKVLFSSSWYLDYLEDNWQKFYSADPRQMVIDGSGDKNLAAGIVGGEACMWGEMVDDRNVINRVWPRTSAVAERLWSSNIGGAPDPTTYRRLEEHTCRMIQRGIDAEPPSGPGFCVV